MKMNYSDSLTACVASTTILLKNSLSAPMSLLDMQVLAALIKQSSPKSSTYKNICLDISFRIVLSVEF